MKTGVIFIEGKPGSGKSFKGMEELLRYVVKHRRQVYSNLPVRERPMKRYLTRKAGRDAYSKLWVPLTEEHFHAHCARAVRIDAEFAKWKEQCRNLGIERNSFLAFERWWNEHHPEDPFITRGEGANWIQSGSVLILDEVHLWTPQAGTQQNKDLLGYASMHRHHHHLILLLTQDTMQAAIEWRRQCIEVIRVDDASAFQLFPGVNLARLGLRNKLARYCSFSWENYQIAKSTNGQQVRPNSTELRWLPFNSHIFHLYDSFGRTGISRRAQQKQLEAQAKAVGVPAPKAKAVVHRKVRPWPALRFAFRWTRRIAFSAAFFAAGVFATRALIAPDPVDVVELDAEGRPIVEAPEFPVPGAVQSIGSDWVRVDGRRYMRGSQYDRDYLVWHVDQADGYAVLVHRHDGPAWLLVPGRPAESLGSSNSLMARFREGLRGTLSVAGADVAAPAGSPTPATDPRDDAGFWPDHVRIGPGPGSRVRLGPVGP